MFSLVGKRLFELNQVPTSHPNMLETCLAITRVTGRKFVQNKKGKRKAVFNFAIQQGLIEAPPPPEPKPPKIKRNTSPKRQSKAAFSAFYLSKPWRTLRYEALRKHGAACQCCGGTARSTGKPLHVDHIKPRFKFPELEMTLENLQILCEDCNMGKGGWDQTDWR